MLFRFIIVFLPQAKASFNFMAAVTIAVILEPKKRKFVTASTFSTSICHEVMGPDATILSFFSVEFEARFFNLLYHTHQELFSFFSLSAIWVVSSAYLRLLQWNITQSLKKGNNAICSNIDWPRDDHTKWSKSERERQIPYDISYMWNLKNGTNEHIYETETDSQD